MKNHLGIEEKDVAEGKYQVMFENPSKIFRSFGLNIKMLFAM